MMIEFQQAPKKDDTDLGEMIGLRRRVAEAREKLEQSVKTARTWKAIKKADTLIFGVSTLVLGGAFAGLLTGSNALAETHHIWSVALYSASFLTLLIGGVTLALTFTRAIGISLANTDLEVAKAELVAFDATPVNELELKEVPTE